MRKAVRAIIIRDNALLVMHRNKFGEEYDTLIGGGIDFGESAEEALYRELREETGITIANPRLVFIEDAGDPYGPQYIFYCEYQAGEPMLAADSDEAEINKLGKNTYTPKWLPLSELEASPFLSEGLKQRIIAGLTEGWPTAPVTFKHVQSSDIRSTS